MDFKEKTLVKNYIHKGKILNLRKDDIELPNGKTAIREIIEHSGGSCVYCEKDGAVYLVKQYRYAYGEELWEIPAGKLNPGEDPKETAIRELEEEAGLKAHKVELMFEVYPTPGYSNEIIRIYRAWDFTQTQMNLDEDEFLSGEWIPIPRLKQMIASGEIKDGKTLIALLKALG
jgi:ADP-ribose pyrophosphatase